MSGNGRQTFKTIAFSNPPSSASKGYAQSFTVQALDEAGYPTTSHRD